MSGAMSELSPFRLTGVGNGALPCAGAGAKASTFHPAHLLPCARTHPSSLSAGAALTAGHKVRPSANPGPGADAKGSASSSRLPSLTRRRSAIRLVLPLLVLAAATTAQTRRIPRTADGRPDLQGVWTNATITPLERPSAFAERPTLTAEEAKTFEKRSADDLAKTDGQSEGPLLAATGSAGTGGYNVLFLDRGSELATVNGLKRTSLVVDPPNGRVPATTEESRRRNMAQRGGRFDSVKDRPLAERCLLGFGSTSGPPMLPVLYNNNYQIVQTPTHVMILVEMVHDARIVRMNGTHPPASVRQWLGDSIGRWEGDTLVVETTNFSDKTRFRGASESLKITERFTMADAGTIVYRATMDDSSTFTKPWTVEYPFLATPGPIYEYACHEGNYSMPDILGGARKAERESTNK